MALEGVVYPEDPRTLECKDIIDTEELPGLFDSVRIGAWELPHRIVMAPLTRARTGFDRTPKELNARYYAQRATAALITSEATIISEQAAGYAFTPGIYNEVQIVGWNLVTDAVKSKDGRMVCQLWHCGRISHPSLQPNRATPVAPSAVKPGESAGLAFTEDGWQPFGTPRALDTSEMPGIVDDYVKAAENAKRAGFDGVEVHGANGYLINQFLCDGTNHRADQYGGSIENRARFFLEAIDAVSEVWPTNQLGVRISPWSVFLDCTDSDDASLYQYVCQELGKRDLAYVSVVEREWLEDEAPERDETVPPSITAFVRNHYSGRILTAGGYTCKTACATIQSGVADLVAFGKAYIANPDLAERIRAHASLNDPDRDTFYAGSEEGYIDYPFMDQRAA